jgi:hypothetical protein
VKYSIVGEKPSRYRKELDIFFMVILVAPFVSRAQSAQLLGDGSRDIDTVREYVLTLLDVEKFGGWGGGECSSREQDQTHKCGE